ncbi:hypothetical protein LCGC14_1368390 [marine sediment metagenome]|uniref:Uncharacterized protein n=1 Tax=marine sediment metagenome TaxID=412755 RepID=A0A0F9K622_9ZZZZ
MLSDKLIQLTNQVTDVLKQIRNCEHTWEELEDTLVHLTHQITIANSKTKLKVTSWGGCHNRRCTSCGLVQKQYRFPQKEWSEWYDTNT